MFSTYGGLYKFGGKFNKHFGERKIPKELIKILKNVSLRLILKDKCDILPVYYFFDSNNLKVEIFS